MCDVPNLDQSQTNSKRWFLQFSWCFTVLLVNSTESANTPKNTGAADFCHMARRGRMKSQMSWALGWDDLYGPMDIYRLNKFLPRDPWFSPKKKPWVAMEPKGWSLFLHFLHLKWLFHAMAAHPESWLDMTSRTPSPQDGTHARFLTQLVTKYAKSIGMLWTESCKIHIQIEALKILDWDVTVYTWDDYQFRVSSLWGIHGRYLEIRCIISFLTMWARETYKLQAIAVGCCWYEKSVVAVMAIAQVRGKAVSVLFMQWLEELDISLKSESYFVPFASTRDFSSSLLWNLEHPFSRPHTKPHARTGHDF